MSGKMFFQFMVIVLHYSLIFKWLLKNQYQGNYSDQSQQGQTARETNQNS